MGGITPRGSGAGGALVLGGGLGDKKLDMDSALDPENKKLEMDSALERKKLEMDSALDPEKIGNGQRA